MLGSGASMRAGMRPWEHTACCNALHHCPSIGRLTRVHARSAHLTLYTQMLVHCLTCLQPTPQIPACRISSQPF